MNIYNQKQRWKLILAILAVAISLFSLFVTNFLVDELKQEERKKIEIWALATKQLVSSSIMSDYSLALKVISENQNIPVILVDECDSVLESRNIVFFSKKDSVILEEYYDEISKDSLANKNQISIRKGEKLVNDFNIFLRKELENMKASENSGIEITFSGDKQWIYYKDSPTLTSLKYYPFYQLLLISLFVLIGYFLFSYSRRSEQNQVWAGMAKETAHQIATPLSSLMAWIEIMKDSPISEDMIIEMQKDLTRLETITERFSKIGSQPELNEYNLNTVIEQSISYLKNRLPYKTDFIFQKSTQKTQVKINKTLIEWVFENICKNSVDAIKGQGVITISITSQQEWIKIEISDSGKGINKNIIKSIFEPGVTTKKRGWGLGLSLSKRIIEDYHKGKIYAKNLKENSGAQFIVLLPSA
tara:strand:- start:2959 stop:4209 length:1251 start_codon:yes stop_codon:yes gene_type:complete